MGFHRLARESHAQSFMYGSTGPPEWRISPCQGRGVPAWVTECCCCAPSLPWWLSCTCEGLPRPPCCADCPFCENIRVCSLLALLSCCAALLPSLDETSAGQSIQDDTPLLVLQEASSNRFELREEAWGVKPAVECWSPSDCLVHALLCLPVLSCRSFLHTA
jgi:hypothetical protein